MQKSKKAFFGQSHVSSASNKLNGRNHNSYGNNINNNYNAIANKDTTTSKPATETWGYQILPSLYSLYQKVVLNI